MVVSPPIITIDGPSGVGKGALCRELSKKLKWNILDSGAIYRVLALVVISKRIVFGIHCKENLIKIASDLDITFENKKKGFCVFLKDIDVTDKIYTEDIGNLASKIAIYPEIRSILLKYQYTFHVFPGLIANGRDMGTVVFPDATLKVFLNASFRVRCERRFQQLQKRGFNVSLDYILKQVKERDDRDRTRKIAPLIPSHDALVFNSTYFSIDEIACGVLKCFYNSLFCCIVIVYMMIGIGNFVLFL